LPLGADPDSGLWEFAHLMTGTPAERDVDGRLILTEATAVVLVLIPAGTFWMGGQSSDPTGRNYDPQAQSDEGPVHEVELSAYFLSKYELTQGQWNRVTGRNPSNYGPDGRWASQWLSSGAATSLLHPVEQVNWLECMEWLPRVVLGLPSEAQWEHGARGGTDSVYWSGVDVASLEGAANLSDAYGRSHGNESWTAWDADLDDGATAHNAVGSYRANAFGLHDVHGNLWEWCLDGYDRDFYPRSPQKDPLAPWDGASRRVARGGALSSAAHNARSASRFDGTRSYADTFLGVRPARVIDP
jgi:formylglycine-generating enzyme required for sulfatase activity